MSSPNFMVGPERRNLYFPYAVGCLISYAFADNTIKQMYELKEIFVNRERIEDVIERLQNPSVIGFSFYVWNARYQLALSKAIKQQYPECLIVFGGNEVPSDAKEFMNENSHIDICCHNDGEMAFKQILLRNLDTKDFTDIKGMQTKEYKTGPSEKVPDINDIPSPYQSGVFDDIIKNNPEVEFHGALETSRGCPYSCTFCDYGQNVYTKVTKYNTDRIQKDVDWLCEHKIQYVMCVDANFGLYKKQDAELADYVISKNIETGYPSFFSATWAKNSNKDILEIAKKLHKNNMLRGFTFAIQSMSKDVLHEVKRSNMAMNNIKEIIDVCEQENLPHYAELILGLPGETYESWCEGLCELIDLSPTAIIETHSLSVLRNSEMGMNKNIVTKQVYGGSDGSEGTEYYPEPSTLMMSTDTMSFDDHMNAKMFSWLCINFHSYGWTSLVPKQTYKFYTELLQFIQNSDGILNQEYNRTRDTLVRCYTEDLNVNHARVIYSSQSVFHANRSEVHNELKMFSPGITIHQVMDINKLYPYKVTINDIEYIVSAEGMETDSMKHTEALYYQKRFGYGKTTINKV